MNNHNCANCYWEENYTCGMNPDYSKWLREDYFCEKFRSKLKRVDISQFSLTPEERLEQMLKVWRKKNE